MIYAEHDGDFTYYHFNAHGDVVVLTTASGTKEKTYSYTSFGIEYNPSTLDDNPFRYCGEYFDIESGNIYLRARYYNSDLGRFTQQDGWGYINQDIPSSLNLYTYCYNNPISLNDPTGHWGWIKKAGAIALTLAVAALAVTAVVATAGTAAAALGMGVGMMMGCSATVATTVTTVATAGAYLVAGTIGAMAVSDSIEIATSDESGNNGYNPIRDTLMGGNQKVYDTVKIVTDVVADGIVDIGVSNTMSGRVKLSEETEFSENSIDDSNAYDNYWSRKAPQYATPNTKYDHYRLNPNTNEMERSTVIYDYAGRQNYRIDWTTHSRPVAHSNPHIHYIEYGAQYDPTFGKEYLLN